MSLLAVIVLYGVRPENSASVRSLLRAREAAAETELHVSILLLDNTPGGQGPVDLPEGIRYQAAGRNRGLAQAYNDAIALAQQDGCEWLLTLDQDTKLPADFLLRFSAIVKDIEGTPEIAAIVPQIWMSNRILSPHFLGRASLMRSVPGGYMGVPETHVYAFNSGSLLRLAALRQAGGYNPRFWLDGSDTDLFHRLCDLGKRVYVAGDVPVQHGFAMLDGGTRVSGPRYENVLLAESAVWDLHLGRLAGVDRTVRLFLRWLRYLRRGDTDLRRLTAAALAQRVFHSGQSRIARWERLTGGWIPPSNIVTPSHSPARISVCMATYNGERYLPEQLASILPQLGEHDEVILVDDASHDRSVSVIRAFADPRIRLLEHLDNQGVVASFEQALRNATGDILFLSDMDDIWAPDKVSRMVQAFEENPSAQIVASSLTLIDEHSRALPSDDFLKHRRSEPGFLANILRNNFQGSTMAIRSSLLQHVLPFPLGKSFLHDVWIGTRNAVMGGQVLFLKEPLLLYRRHTSNVSRTQSRGRQLRARLQLLWAHLQRVLLDLR